MTLLPTYLMAFGALTFAGLSALAFIRVLGHLDDPAKAPAASSPAETPSPEHVAA